ncbi:T9SS type A sorting domain-containing protein [Hymenobacter edaphi]|uniref:Secretion system C-terminal sorting domain-containing protein n=1 Tax=Hymenobacter edaphi TaxID=2211146 RepID=A0A328BRT7_9BACT|nr:T9SS type A sorting domain-containing protein [Hymenobacter edaphi]RAK69405.1 hypothetical protein DLM85_00635 [Hymenobacter edaphi]
MKVLLLLGSLAAALLARPAAAQWTPNAQLNTPVRDVAGVSEVTPLLAPNPLGGSYVSWFEQRGAGYDLRLQRLDAAGNPQWGPAGLLVSNQPQSSALYRYDLKSDHAGNALVAFQDIRSGASQCVIYKISPTGQQLWGANGIPLLDPNATSGLSPAIGVTTTNNVLVAWNASGAGVPKWVALQKFTPAGVPVWSSVQRVQDAVKRYSRPAFIPTGVDDVVLSYVEETGAGLGVSTMYANLLAPSGAAVWAAPVRVSDKPIGFAFFPEMVADGRGGYYVLFNTGNPANATLGDAYVQHVDAAGALWSPSGTEALTGTGTTRFAGKLELVWNRDEVWAAINVRDLAQGSSGMALQRFERTSGAAQLGATGAVVQPVSSAYYSATGLRDVGNGLVLVYTENSSAVNRLLKATKLDYVTQQPLWPGGAVTIGGSASEKQNYSTSPFAGNQLVTVWEDARQDRGIYAQNLSSGGLMGTATATRAGRAARPLTLFPNPGAAPTLRLQLPQPQTLTLRLTDLAGRVVQQRTVALPAGAHDVPLPAADLAAGLYVVHTEVAGQALRGTWVKP